MAKNKSCIKCLIGIFCTACLLLGLVHTAFADLVTFSPGTLPSGTLFPIAISKEIADQHDMYDSPSSTIRIGASYHYPNSEAGEWTSFLLDTNDVADMVDLIQNGNPIPLSVGDNIWLEPGTKQAVYSSVADLIGQDVVIPVVNVIISDTSHSEVPIYGFIGFHITDSVGGSGKYIEGYFLDNILVQGGTGIGPDYGVRSPAPTLIIQNLVTKYYNDVLDRAPEPGGAEWWVVEIERIASSGIDIREGFQGLAKFFFDSEEYGLKGKDDVAFVTDLYQTFLNRAPDADGLNFWLNYLGQGLTRDMLITQFAYSEEFNLYMANLFGTGAMRPEDNLVNDLYRGFLNRFPDTGGFNGWVGMMRNAQCTGAQAVKDLTYQIALGFVQSAEYGLRNRNNQEYVEDLYNGILRRGADPAGFTDWVNLLTSGTYTREQMLPLFTNSAEFQFRVTDVINAGCMP